MIVSSSHLGGTFAQAVNDSLRAISLDSTYTRGHARAAKALLCMGKVEASLEKYAAAMETDQGNRQLRFVASFSPQLMSFDTGWMS
eukprot:scaffold134797_cov17-Prasinocladus_malaysianus.AAC.1